MKTNKNLIAALVTTIASLGCHPGPLSDNPVPKSADPTSYPSFTDKTYVVTGDGKGANVYNHPSCPVGQIWAIYTDNTTPSACVDRNSLGVHQPTYARFAEVTASRILYVATDIHGNVVNYIGSIGQIYSNGFATAYFDRWDQFDLSHTEIPMTDAQHHQMINLRFVGLGTPCATYNGTNGAVKVCAGDEVKVNGAGITGVADGNVAELFDNGRARIYVGAQSSAFENYVRTLDQIGHSDFTCQVDPLKASGQCQNLTRLTK